MNDIKFYDFEFNLLHIEPVAESANFTVKFCGEGTFELHFRKNFSAKRELIDNFNIQNGKGICITSGNRNGIVTGMRIEDDFAVYGKTCDYIFKKKIVLPFENLEIYNPSQLCAHFLNNAFADTDAVISASDSEEFEDIFSKPFTQKHPKTLYNTFNTILSDANLGYCMNFDTAEKKWIFKVLNPVFTEKKFICDSATAYDITLSFDTKNYFSHILSKNDSEEYEYIKKHGGTGLYRWEELSQPDDDLLCDLNFKFMRLKFEKDYFLGDRFKIFTEYGIFTVTVSEVSISGEGAVFSESPVLKILKEDYI